MLMWLMIFLINASAAEIRIPVKGMVCGFCAQGISKKLAGEAAVSEVKVSLESQLVTVTLRDGLDLKDARVAELIEDAGFTPGKIERNQ